MADRYKLPVVATAVVCLVLTWTMVSDAAQVAKRNIGDLIAMGEVIVHGNVIDLNDGFDSDGVPFTRVTVEVKESTKGDVAGTYTFRQYGLIEPRDMGNGLVNLNVTPDGWPTYSMGEEVVLFLYKAGSWTGLRTTVGLFQGKFTVKDGMVTNVIDNEGLFENLNIDRRTLSEKEREMVSMHHGRVPVDVFTSFVRKAVNQRWFKQETGE